MPRSSFSSAVHVDSASVQDAAGADSADPSAIVRPAGRATHRLIVFFSALGGLLFGYDTAVINAALFEMKDYFHFALESWEAGLVVSVAVAGAFVGALLAGVAGNAVGRKVIIGAADALFVAGSVLLVFSSRYWMLLAGRAVVGLGIGASSVIIPVYLAEITPAETRGRVVTFNNLFITGGQFVAASIGGLFVYTVGAELGWRLLFGIGAVPALVQLAGLALLPESPRWLAVHGRGELAARNAKRLGISLAHVREDCPGGTGQQESPPGADERAALLPSPPTPDAGGPPALPAPLRAVAAAVRNYRALFSPRLRRRLVVGVGLQALQQLSGINTVMYYSATILKNAGFSGDRAPVALSIPLAFGNAAFTIVGMVVVERWGRRLLLKRSLAGCLLATVAMAVVGALLAAGKVERSTGGWLFLALLFLYVAAFAPGMGPVPWVVNAEIYPNELRSDAAALATMTNWAANAGVSQGFPVLMGAVGTGPTFAVISALIVLALVFVQFVVPETRLVALEDMGRLFAEGAAVADADTAADAITIDEAARPRSRATSASGSGLASSSGRRHAEEPETYTV